MLTCKDCNDFGGHQLDWHWANSLDVWGFLDGNLTESRTARFYCGEAATTVAITSVDRNVDLRVIDEASSNAAIAAQQAQFRAFDETNPPTLRLEFHKSRFSERRVRASVLRAGYLMGFALTGYRFLGLWNPIREQIRDPDREQLPRLVVFHHEHPATRRSLAIVNDPSDCRSILVGFGRWTALIPLTPGSRLFEPLVTPESFNFRASPLEWPFEPSFGLPAASRSDGPAHE